MGTPTTKTDLLTVIAIAFLAYVIQNVLHEGVGHGGAVLLSGAEPVSWSTCYFEHDGETIGETASRFVAAAGMIVNTLAGFGLWFLLRRMSGASSHLRYFLWLTMIINLLTAAGYPLFSGVLGVGDGIVIVAGAERMWAWRLGMAVVGALLYLLCIRFGLRELARLMGEAAERPGAAHKLSLVPYIAGSIGSTIGSLFNPISPVLIATSAASAFGGTSALAWITQLHGTSWFRPGSGLALELPRHWGWIVVGGAALALHAAILGPSVRF